MEPHYSEIISFDEFLISSIRDTWALPAISDESDPTDPSGPAPEPDLVAIAKKTKGKCPRAKAACSDSTTKDSDNEDDEGDDDNFQSMLEQIMEDAGYVGFGNDLIEAELLREERLQRGIEVELRQPDDGELGDDVAVPIADGLVVAPDFDTDALSWTEYIRHYGLVEVFTFASTKYVFKKIGESDGNPVGTIYCNFIGQCNMRAVCKRHPHCVCWVKARNPGGGPMVTSKLLRELVKWFADDSDTTDAHEIKGVEVKKLFGMSRGQGNN